MYYSFSASQVSKSTVLDIVYASADFEHLWILPESHKLDFFIIPPAGKGWVKVKGNGNYTKDKVLPHLTMMGTIGEDEKQRPTDSGRQIIFDYAVILCAARLSMQF